MNLVQTFEVAFESIIGDDHIKLGKNNQDAVLVRHYPGCLVLLVADGCSAGKFSEVGSNWILPVLAEIIHDNHSYLVKHQPERFWGRTRDDLMAQSRIFLRQMGGSLTQAIQNYFLFTLIGMIILEEETFLFSFGDGVYALNETIHEIGPFPDNEPPFFGYALDPSGFDLKFDPASLQFKTEQQMPTSEINSFLVGTDGLCYLVKAQDQLIPGKDKLVGSISQFWQRDEFFTQPDALRRWLRDLSPLPHRAIRVDWKEERLIRLESLLKDDLTLIVGRRRKQRES